MTTIEAEEQFQTSFNKTLNELRETLHRHAKLSSRNEALEELGKLVFVQVISIKNHIDRIDSLSSIPLEQKAKSLCSFVEGRMREFLPKELLKELSIDDFLLKIKPSEVRLADEIIKSFQLTDWQALTKVLHLDVFNEIFGRFLNDSFSQEKELGQYLTPSEMVSFMVRCAISKLSDSEIDVLTDPVKCKEFGYVLDPSCGVASFLTEFVRALIPLVIERHGKPKLRTWLDNISEHVLVGIDKSERMIKLAISNLAISGLDKTTLHSMSSLDREKDNGILTRLEGNVRLILTNPPFGAEFGGAHLIKYKISTVWCSRPPAKVESEILFLERYLDWLTETGVCVTVIPDSILTNKGLFADLRNGMRDKIQLKAVISFPPETFAAAGTTAKTSVITFTKSVKNNAGLCYFVNCKHIGFKVVKQGAHKKKVSLANSQLPQIAAEISGFEKTELGQFIDFDTAFSRWDATYHAYLPVELLQKLADKSINKVYLSDYCEIVNDRVNPSREDGVFNYIEISDVDAASCSVTSKVVRCQDAPSRARKRVRVGDVLVSTVRPEQGKVGVVLDINDDNAVCTTGFVVIRPVRVNPLLIARLLQSDFVVRQLMRSNVGVAYPTVEESAFSDLVLPISESEILSNSSVFDELLLLEKKTKSLRRKTRIDLEEIANVWENSF